MSHPSGASGGGRPSSRGGGGGGGRPGSAPGGWPVSPDDDGWGPSTAVYSGAGGRNGSPARPANPRVGRAFGQSASMPVRGGAESWAPAGPRSGREARADRRTAQSVQALVAMQARQAQRRAAERGLPWWAALLLLIAIAAVGGVIDTLGSIQIRGGFNIGIVVASIVAIIAVKRSHMFPVVIAPPIVYSAAAILQLYVRSSGLHDKKVVLDAAANYLVYGFPAIAAATAVVLIIAGIRLITRK